MAYTPPIPEYTQEWLDYFDDLIAFGAFKKVESSYKGVDYSHSSSQSIVDKVLIVRNNVSFKVLEVSGLPPEEV